MKRILLLHDAVGEHAFEDFCWRAAALSQEPLVPVDTDRTCRLLGWPEVETGQLPVQWLLPMAAMMIRPWQPGELAQATGVDFALESYEVHSMGIGRDARGEANLSTRIDGETLTGQGTSRDVLEASAIAWLDVANRVLRTQATQPVAIPA